MCQNASCGFAHPASWPHHRGVNQGRGNTVTARTEMGLTKRCESPSPSSSSFSSKAQAEVSAVQRPSQTLAHVAGPWLWAHAQQREKAYRDEGDLERAIAEGQAYLTSFSAAAAAAARAAGESQVELGRRALGELHEIARRNRITCGKWMLFFDAERVDAAWEAIATATERGELGDTSKVATSNSSYANNGTSHLVCVYVQDFADRAQVARVLRRLGELGFRGQRPLQFKTDYMTYLDLYAHNDYHIPVCLYSSESFTE